MSLNNMGMGINININVNTSAAQANAQGVAQALNQVAVAGTHAAKAAGGAQRQFAQLAGAFVQMTVGKQILGVFAGLATRADAVTMGMQNIKTVMDTSFGAGEEEKLKSRIMSVSETTGKSFGEVAEATKNLIAQGLSPGQANTLLMPLMKFATVGDLSIQKATDLTVALTNMGIGATHAGAAYDVMFNLSRQTSLETKDFADVMTRTAPVAAMVGMSFNELAVTAAFMRKSFGAAKLESTALANTLLFLEKTKPEAKIKAAFGVDAIDQATGKLKPLLTLIQEVGAAMAKGKGTEHDIADIFGGKTGAQVFAGGIATLRQGMSVGGKQMFGDELVNALRTIPGQSGGSVNEAFSEKMQALTPQLKRLGEAFDNLVGTFGGKFADSLTKAVAGFTDLLTGIREFLAENPGVASGVGLVVDQLAKLAAVVGVFAVMGGGMSILKTALGPVLMGIRTLTSGLFGVGVAGRVAGVAVGGLWRSLLGPLGLILLLVDLVPTLLKFFGIGQNMTDKSLEASKIIRDSALANATAANAMATTAAALEEATREYKELVVEYDHMMLSQAPKIDPRVEGTLNKALTEWASKTGGIAKESLTPVINAMHDLFMYAAKGQQAPNEVMDRATRAAQFAGSAARYLEGLGTTGAKADAARILDFLKNLNIGSSKQATEFYKADKAIREGRDVTQPGMPFIDPQRQAGVEAAQAAVDRTKVLNASQKLTFKPYPVDLGTRTPSGREITIHRYTPIEVNIDGTTARAAMKGVEEHEEVLETSSH